MRKRDSGGWRGLAVGVVLCLCAVLCAWRPLDATRDFWVHAAVGRWMVQHGAVPHHALLIWTGATPWVAHSWASELLFYGCMAVGGEGGGPVLALGFTALMAGAMVGLVAWWWLRCGGSPGLLLACGLGVLLLVSGRFTPRPELFSLLFTVILLILLDGQMTAEESGAVGGKWLPLAVGALFTLWSNCHGLVFVGLAMLALTCVLRAVQLGAGARSSAVEAMSPMPHPRTWLLALGAGLVATLLNPRGAALWGVIGFLQRSPNHNFNIVEFTSPLAWKGGYPLDLTAVSVALFLAGALGPILQTRHITARIVVQWGWLLVVTALYLSAVRHVGFFCFTVFMILAGHGVALPAESEAVPGRRQRVLRVLRPLGWGLCGLGLLVQQVELHRVGGFASVTPDLPAGAATFINQECHGQLFNAYNLSSYLAWETAPTHPLFIHALNTSDVLADSYQDIVSQSDAGQKLLRRGPIGFVALVPPQPGTRDLFVPLAMELAFEHKNWALVYGSREAFVWARRTPANQALIAWREPKLQVPPTAFLPRFMESDPRSHLPIEYFLPVDFSRRLVGGYLP